MMDLTFNLNLSQGYKSKSQIARLLTENWVLNNSYCPNCGELPLNEFEKQKSEVVKNYYRWCLFYNDRKNKL